MRFILFLVLLLWSTSSIAEDPLKEKHCLEAILWNEVRGEPDLCKAIVAQVVWNRVHSDKYPDSYCKVAYQRRQFENIKPVSYYREKILNTKAGDTIQRVASATMKGEFKWLVPEYVLNFISKGAKGSWIKKMRVHRKCGGHWFLMK